MNHRYIRTAARPVLTGGSTLPCTCGGRPALGDRMLAARGSRARLARQADAVNAAIEAAEHQTEDGEDLLVEDGNDGSAGGERKLEVARKPKAGIEAHRRPQLGVPAR